MDITRFSLKHRLTTLFFCFILLATGVVSYFRLGRLEDPNFTIKMAVVAAVYPGASVDETQRDVTTPLTEAINTLEEVRDVSSRTEAGLTMIYVDLDFKYGKNQLPQIWDKLRHKVSDRAKTLPPSVQTIVQDDFSDVYGQYYALQGDGYSLDDLNTFAKVLKRELSQVKGVASVAIIGHQSEAIYVEFDPAKLAAAGLPPEITWLQITNQTVPSSSGVAHVGPNVYRVATTGGLSSVDDVANMTIGGGLAPLVRLGDVAKIRKGPLEPRSLALTFNGRPALGIGISTVRDGNVVTMGRAVDEKVKELQAQCPVGMTLTPIYLQSEEVVQAVDGFVINVAESVAIVIGVLLLFMGLHTGLLVGLVLMLIIAATLFSMQALGITMQIVSLGSLIIALGMLVDNTIVISEGLLVGLERHEYLPTTASRVGRENFWPLLGGTLIAILSFTPIGLNNDLTGEYCRSLFQVVGLSLAWSWLLAMIAAPALGSLLLSPPKEQKDSYNKPLFRAYRSCLEWALHHRALTLIVTVLLFGLSVWGFTTLKIAFFPDTNSPYFTVDLWSPQGTGLEEHLARSQQLATRLRARDDVQDVTVCAGGGGLRFILTINPELPNSSYSQLLVRCKPGVNPDKPRVWTQRYLDEQNPDLEGIAKGFSKGGGFAPKIEARFTGTDKEELRRLGEEALDIFRAHGGALFPRINWRNRVPVLRPVLSEQNMRQAGLNRLAVNRVISMAMGGVPVGLYREGGDLLPLMATLSSDVRHAPEKLMSLPLWAPNAGRTIPLSAVASRVETQWDDSFLWARNGELELTAQTDLVDADGADAFLKDVRPLIEALPRSPVTKVAWGGEYETSTWAKDSVMGPVPFALSAMFFITVMLFNSFTQPLIIFACVPLILIGVTPGLLIFKQPFSFMALLGVISLMGMLIKNSIVLLDQIAVRFKNGDEPYQVIVESGISRLRPVSLSALTTVLGMVPLVKDRLFAPLAVTIMTGLTVATFLTLFLVPVLCALAYRVKIPDEQ